MEAIDEHPIRPETELAKFSITQAFNAGLGVKLEVSSPLAPLLGVAPSLGCNFKSERAECLEAKRFRVTTFWNPPDEYVDRALRDPEVLGYIKKSCFSTPLYMVISVAVATLVTRERKSSRRFDGNAGAGSLGSELHANDATIDQDTILAYRVRRIQYERKKDKFEKARDNDTKFCFFGSDRVQIE